ncbi:hypothetical protein EI42_02267 [Thermosporothrix hazakensis]|jgi:hypothetical protein|uniref:Uncharacterized protein n=1 Tax=Thermosporothrix hazakensis TaxID=644383 RepID=A0A326U8N2_THEHA|nr:hypothetical protein [Thermosporothrix hazakensis]PZW31170.1 hypothetical protein EI42_02267 [Thermosporothrix hazakensis]GCE50919.1 hypothetical protein KTH_57880 [Thermosporothrix hazakensis]
MVFRPQWPSASAFYLHYQDTYVLVRSIFREAIDALVLHLEHPQAGPGRVALGGPGPAFRALC